MIKRTLLRTLPTLALLALTACATTSVPTNISDTAARTPQLSTLNGLLIQSGLDETLRGPGPYTVFAPSDEAFKAVPAATLDKMKTDRELLRSVLSYHVLPGKVAAADVATGTAKTVNGASVALSRSGTFVTVDDAIVQTADMPASNGVVHIVDRVLMPPKK